MKTVDIEKIKNEILHLSNEIRKINRQISIMNSDKESKQERLNTLLYTLDLQTEMDFYEKDTD
jgi:predicted  nucleic acid-binding Zn-ribbon protein